MIEIPKSEIGISPLKSQVPLNWNLGFFYSDFKNK